MKNPDEAAGAHLEVVACSCSSQSCPTIFRDRDGNFVIQGYKVEAEKVGVTVPPGEALVSIPCDLLRAAFLTLAA